MVKISIFTLIYRSTQFADFVYESLNKYTPMIARGEAEFFFVANDASPEVLKHLADKKYPFYEFNNQKLSDEELFKKGYGKPEYIARVYKGFNFGIERSKGEIVVILNSDMAFSPDWLENLLKYVTEDTIVSSQLVERDHPRYDVFKGAYHGEFGCCMADYKEEEFLKFVLKMKATGLVPGIAFAPCAFYKSNAVKVGLYPEGNIAGESFDDVIETGDQRFFWNLSKINVNHYTALDSIVYHFKEGEMTSDPKNKEKPNDITQPNYYPLKRVKAVGDKVVFDSQPWYVIRYNRGKRRIRKFYKLWRHRAGMVKNRMLGKNK